MTPTDTLIVALGAEPTTLDPRFATDAGGMRIGGLIFNTLVRVGPGFEVVGDAAESWSLNVKKREYSFRLKDGLKFHNGRLLTPADVLFSFEEFRSSRALFASSLERIESVSADLAKDGRIEVRIKLKSLSDKFLVADLPIVRLLPKAETLSAGIHFQRKPIGTGAYRFVERGINEIRLAGVTAKTPHLVFKVIRDDFTRYQKMLKHEVDLAQAELPLEKTGEFLARPAEFEVFRFPGLAMTYLLINFNDPTLRRREVREAISRAINRREIIATKLQGLATEATSILTPNNPHFNPDLKNPPFDPEGAARLIREAGLTGALLNLKTSNAPQAIDNGKVLANQLSRAGLDVQMRSYEWATFYDDVKKGNFQMATMRWVGTVDPDIYRSIFHSKEAPPGRNRGSYRNPRLDSLLEEGARVEDAKRRHAVYQEVQRMVHEDLAIIPLWYDTQVAVADRRLQGYRPEPSGDFRPFANIEKRERRP